MVQLIRDVSQALFSAPYRLEILLTVLALTDDEPFTTGTVYKALVERLGEDALDAPDRTTVNRTLKSLSEAELTVRVGKGGKYRRIESKFWTLLGEYSTELEHRFSPTPLDIAR